MQLWLSNNALVKPVLYLFVLRFDLTLCTENNSFLFLDCFIVWTLIWIYDSSLLILICWFCELSQYMTVCDECHVGDIIVGYSSLFCKDGKFSTAVRWPYQNPGATFIKISTLWFSSNRNKRCWISHLLYLDPFIHHYVNFFVQIVYLCILAYMFANWPIKAARTFWFFTTCVSGIKEFIVSYRASCNVTMAPEITNYPLHVVSTEIMNAYALIKFSI